MRRFFILLLLISLQPDGFGQATRVMQPEEMRADFVYLRNYLEITHPMLYLHHSKEIMNAKLDSLASTLDKPIPLPGFYGKIAWCIALVGCEHTTSNYGAGFDQLVKTIPVFPYQLYFFKDRVSVMVNMTTSKEITPGDEVISINGRSVDTIRKALYQYIPADGFITTSKDLQLSGMAFNVWYYLFIEQTNEYKVAFRKKTGEVLHRTEKAAPISSLNKRAVKNKVNKSIITLSRRLDEFRKEPLRLALIPGQNAAVLSVQTFVSEIEPFRKKLDSLFSIIRRNNTEKLIIELANNGGGEVELAADLLNYFITSPTSIVEYSYLITDSDEHLKLANIPEEIRTSKYDYIEPLKDGKAMTKLSKYAGELKMLEPRADRFTGKVYLFVNGGTSSAASTFTAVMKSLGLATIVGEETGGTYAGGGTAIGLDLTLPHSHITTHTGLIYQRFRTTGGVPHRGVLPDIEYSISLDDLLGQQYPWRQFILDLK